MLKNMFQPSNGPRWCKISQTSTVPKWSTNGVFFSTSMLVYWRVMELEWVLYDMYESSPEFLEYVPNIDIYI